jgi:hypothetical protein
MGEVVEKREDDAKGLLHAHEAVEGPFAMELVDGLRVGWIVGKARVGDNMLTRVVTLGWTVPEEEAAVKGWKRVSYRVGSGTIRKQAYVWVWVHGRNWLLCRCAHSL